MRRGLSIFYAVFIFALLAACEHQAVHDYEEQTPTFHPQTFFDGQLKAYGLIKNRSGRVTRRFEADIMASWDDGVGVLDETFYFDDGEVSKRLWTLELGGDSTLFGQAGDVIGQASGAFSGSALHWRYTLQIPYKDSSVNVKIDDWLYLITENRLINESDIKKFGFKMGSITLVLEKL